MNTVWQQTMVKCHSFHPVLRKQRLLLPSQRETARGYVLSSPALSHTTVTSIATYPVTHVEVITHYTFENHIENWNSSNQNIGGKDTSISHCSTYHNQIWTPPSIVILSHVHMHYVPLMSVAIWLPAASSILRLDVSVLTEAAPRISSSSPLLSSLCPSS